MTSPRDVELDIIARDKTAKAARAAARNFAALKKRVDASKKSNDKWAKAAGDMAKKAASMAKTVLKGASAVASLASLTGPAVAGLLAMGKAALVVGKGVAAMAPLAAFIPSLVGAVGLIAGTLKLAAPGLQRAFQPVTRAFYDANGNATKLTRTVQDLVSRGVEPLSRQFVKVNLPNIASAMNQVATATNGVVVRTMEWINSAEGVSLIKTITAATADSFTKLAPKIDAAVVAMLRLSGRAGDKAITGLGDVIGRVLDKFTLWANNTSIDDINAALDKFKSGWAKAKEGFEHVRTIVDWVVQNQAKIHAFSTALGVFALIGGIVTGQWWAAIVAGIGILLGNWDTVTTTFNGAKAWWSATWNGIKNDPVVQDLVAALKGHFERMVAVVVPAFAKFKTDVMPRLVELKDTIKKDVIPALTSFINAVSPIVAWFAEKLLPVVMSTLSTLVSVVSGALKVLSGIINVITALITGDWSKFWQGIKQIVTGNMQVAVSILSNGWSAVKAAFSTGIGATTALLTAWKDRVVGAFTGAGTWLAGVGRAIVDGLANAITGAWSRVSGAVGGLIDKAKSAIPGPLRSALGFSGGTDGWRPAQFAAQFAGGPNFAMAGGGGSRTGGASPVSVNSNVSVNLDGAPFYAMTTKAITAAQKRADWRNRMKKR